MIKETKEKSKLNKLRKSIAKRVCPKCKGIIEEIPLNINYLRNKEKEIVTLFNRELIPYIFACKSCNYCVNAESLKK